MNFLIDKFVKTNDEAGVAIYTMPGREVPIVRVYAATWDAYDGYKSLPLSVEEMREFAAMLNEGADALEAYNASRS